MVLLVALIAAVIWSGLERGDESQDSRQSATERFPRYVVPTVDVSSIFGPSAPTNEELQRQIDRLRNPAPFGLEPSVPELQREIDDLKRRLDCERDLDRLLFCP